jgi:hypothetical protein
MLHLLFITLYLGLDQLFSSVRDGNLQSVINKSKMTLNCFLLHHVVTKLINSDPLSQGAKEAADRARDARVAEMAEADRIHRSPYELTAVSDLQQQLNEKTGQRKKNA